MSYLKESKAAQTIAGLIGFAMTLSLFVGLGALTASASSYTFNTNLSAGSRGVDVMHLQETLNENAATQVAASGAGSPGNETTFFGPATKRAVIKFQQAHSITPAIGNVFTITRGVLNGMVGTIPTSGTEGCQPGALFSSTTGRPCGTPTQQIPGCPAGALYSSIDGKPCGTGTPIVIIPSVGTGLTVSSATQPLSGSIAPQGATRIPFTKFTVTAGTDGSVTMSGVKVERTGQAADASFAGVVLLDENGAQIGISRTFGADHMTTVGSDQPVVIAAGTSKTFTLAGNMAADNSTRAGQVATLTLEKVNTTALVNGGQPVYIQGASYVINANLTIGSVTNARGSLDPNGAQSKNVGVTGFTFSSIQVTAGSQEDVRLMSLRWNQASSAGASDIANIATIVDGTSYPTTVSADGKYYTASFGAGLVIVKGANKEISVKGDISGGSGRTVAFNIEKTTDIYLVGETYHFGISPATSGTGFTSGSIWYPASTVTINTGSISVENATSVGAQNIPPGLANQALGGFNVDVKGETITVASMTFNVATTGSGGGTANQLLTNVSLVDQNGATVAGPVDATYSDATTQRLTFSDTVLFPIGKNTYTLKGKVGTGFPNNGTLIVSFTPGGSSAPYWSNITGQITGKTITATPTSLVSANTMTVKSGALTISATNDIPAQNIVAGVQRFTFAKYNLDAGASGEDLRLSTLQLNTAVSSSASNITKCVLYDGDNVLQTSSNEVTSLSNSSTTTFTLDKALTITKGTVKVLALKCNVSASASGTYQFGISSSASITTTGLISSQSITPTITTSNGGLITMSTAGTWAITLDTPAQPYRLVAAGTTGNTVGVLNIRVNTEDMRINGIALQNTTNLVTASSSPADTVLVSLFDDATLVGQGVFTTGTSTMKVNVGNCTGCSPLVITKDTNKLITIKVDTAPQGQNLIGLPGALIAIDWDGGNGNDSEATGISSGTRILTTGTDTAVNGIRVVKSYPTFALVDLPSKLLAIGRPDLFRFKVTASPSGKIGISSIVFRIATSSATSQSAMIVNTNVYAFTDSSYSTAVSGIQTDGALAAANLPGSLWTTSSSNLKVSPETTASASTTVTINAGQTVYFAIRGDSTVAGTQYSVATQLQGDGKFVADLNNSAFVLTGQASTSYLATTSFLVGPTRGASYNFVWSPFSTTTTSSISNNANDFMTGYGIPGLPTSNTNTQSLSQAGS